MCRIYRMAFDSYLANPDFDDSSPRNPDNPASNCFLLLHPLLRRGTGRGRESDVSITIAGTDRNLSLLSKLFEMFRIFILNILLILILIVFFSYTLSFGEGRGEVENPTSLSLLSKLFEMFRIFILNILLILILTILILEIQTILILTKADSAYPNSNLSFPDSKFP
jgi:hypothetical protein